MNLKIKLQITERTKNKNKKRNNKPKADPCMPQTCARTYLGHSCMTQHEADHNCPN